MRVGESIWRVASRGLCVAIVGLGVVGLGGNLRDDKETVERGVVGRSGGPKISAEQAVVAALNRVRPAPGGFTVEHPRHRATFTPEGVSFEPRRGGPQWRWRLSGLGAEGTGADSGGAAEESRSVSPERSGAGAVSYP